MEPQANVPALVVWAIATIPIGALTGYFYERLDSTRGIGNLLGPIMGVNVFASFFISAIAAYFALGIINLLALIIIGIVYGVIVFLISIFCADYGYHKWLAAVRKKS